MPDSGIPTYKMVCGFTHSEVDGHNQHFSSWEHADMGNGVPLQQSAAPTMLSASQIYQSPRAHKSAKLQAIREGDHPCLGRKEDAQPELPCQVVFPYAPQSL